MNKQIRTTGFRNAKHTGYSFNKEPDGVGMILDELFLFCLSDWHEYKMNGPTLIIYPHREVLCSAFKEDSPEGVWMYKPNSNYRIFGHQPMSENKAVAIELISANIIVECQVQDNSFQMLSQKEVSSEEDKWKHIQKIIRHEVPKPYRGIKQFVNHYFVEKMGGEFSELQYHSNKLYSFNFSQTIGFCLDKHDKIESIGEYYVDEIIEQPFGRKYDHIQDIIVQEGVFKTGEVFAYQGKRPSEARKKAHNYFCKTNNFLNKFIYNHNADELFHELSSISMGFEDVFQSILAQKKIQAEPVFRKQEQSRKSQEEIIRERKSEINYESRRISPNRSSPSPPRHSPNRRSNRKYYNYVDPEPVSSITTKQFRLHDLSPSGVKRKYDETQVLRNRIRELELEKDKLLHENISYSSKNISRPQRSHNIYQEKRISPTLQSSSQNFHESAATRNSLYREKVKVSPFKVDNFSHQRRQQYEPAFGDRENYQRSIGNKYEPQESFKMIHSTSRTISPFKAGKRSFKYID